MTQTPKISVIIPTYNRSKTVCDAIDSVLGQTYSNVEIVVVDDGSTDDTMCKLDKFRKRVGVVCQRNAGPSAARHAGVLASNGELLAFLDSDDLWRRGFLERCNSVLQAAGAETPCCISNAELVRARGKRNTSFDNATLLPGCAVGLWLNVTEILVSRFVQTCQTMLMRRSAYEQAGGFNPNVRFDEDHDLALRLSLLGHWAFVADPLVVWRQSEDSISRKVLEDNRLFVECELLKWQRFEALVEAHGGRLLSQVRREIEKSQHLILSGNNRKGLATPVSRFIHGIMQLYERGAGAAYRRSPWYPKMKTTKLPDEALCPPPSDGRWSNGMRGGLVESKANVERTR